MCKLWKSPFFVLAAIIGCSLAFAACLAPTGPDTAAPIVNDPVAAKGFFIDGPLAGLKYLTSSGKTGTTDANGGFDYMTGDTVEFFLGSQILGTTVTAQKTISPLTLCGTTTLEDGSAAATRATNMIRLLMAMDTKANPYGITLPAAVHTAATSSINSLLDSANFAAEASTLVAAATSAAAVIPTVDAAKDHWAISLDLINGLTSPANADKNMFLTVKIPTGYNGFTLNLSYHAQTLPAGVTSYVSGQNKTVPPGGGIITFSEKMHSSHWQMTLSLIQDPTTSKSNDLLSFFGASGFGKTLPTDYPLDMTGGQKNLEIDLSNSSASVVIPTVHQVSGNLLFLKALPGDIDWTATTYSTSFSYFANILDSSSKTIASFSLRPVLADKASWTTDTDPLYWAIPYTIDLPDGYTYKTQIYYRTISPGGKDTYAFASVPNLTAATTGINFKTTSWDVPRSNP